jgi:hypothetical protein
MRATIPETGAEDGCGIGGIQGDPKLLPTSKSVVGLIATATIGHVGTSPFTRVSKFILECADGRQTMNLLGSLDKLCLGQFTSLLGVTLTICLAVSIPARAQCAGLHAGITAEFVQVRLRYTEPAHVQLVFLLINDSDSAVDAKAGSWKIVVDGVELQDSDWIFGNGPMPTGGWTTLEAGQYYEVGKALPTSKYFPVAGQHTISWRGEGFRSSTITIKVSNTL